MHRTGDDTPASLGKQGYITRRIKERLTTPVMRRLKLTTGGNDVSDPSAARRITWAFMASSGCIIIAELLWSIGVPLWGHQIPGQVLGLTIPFYFWLPHLLVRDDDFSIPFLAVFFFFGYLVVWFYFAHLYYDSIYIFDPKHAFSLPSTWDNSSDKYRYFLYFSMVTQSTVGYGDIYPLTTIARSAVIAHLIVAKAYEVYVFGVLVAKIASKYLVTGNVPPASGPAAAGATFPPLSPPDS
jgi:hypothetical protein